MSAREPSGLRRSGLLRTICVCVCVAAACALPLAGPDGFQLLLAELCLIYGLLAVSLNFSFGRLNSLPFSQAGFFGVGAYTTAVCLTHTDSVWIALASALALAFVLSLGLGYLSAHLAGFEFSMVTLAFAVVFQTIVSHWDFTGGAAGILLQTEPRLDLGVTELALDTTAVYVVTAVGTGILLLVADAVLRSKVGALMLSVRDHAGFSRSLGLNPAATRLAAFIASSVYASAAGVFYFLFQGIAAPSSFDVQVGLMLALMVIAGGKSFFWGPALGAVVFTVVPQVVSVPQDWVWLAIGALMIVLVIAMPQGIASIGSSVADRLLPGRTTPTADMERRVIERSRDTVRNADGHPSGGRLLTVEQVTRDFGGLRALDDVSLHVDAGEVVGVVGSNGSGKTTLFNVVSGHIPATSGRVRFGDRDITSLAPERIGRLGLVRTFQEGAVFTDLTVDESFEMARLGALSTRRAAFLRAALCGSLATPWVRGDLQVKNLSHGAQRLLMIATAFASNPRLVLLDEPAAGLGTQEAEWVVDLIRDARERGIAVVVIEHHMDMIASVCDRLVVLGNGKVVTTGRSEEVMRDSRVVESLLGQFGSGVFADTEMGRVVHGDGTVGE